MKRFACMLTLAACMALSGSAQELEPTDTADSLVEQAPLEKEPVLTNFVKATYPEALLKQGITGTVMLDLVVNEQGIVDSCAVVKGVHPLLDSAVAVAAARFTFSPAMAGGKPVPVLLTYEYRVTLEDVVRTITEYVNFSGRVVERGTRAPVPGALVYVTFRDTASDTTIKVPFSAYLQKIGTFEGQDLQGSDLVTTADSAGGFTFTSLPAGRMQVTIQAPGCERFVENETIEYGKALEATYRVQRNDYSDYEIVVYGKAEKKEVAQRTLTLNEVKKIPGFGGDAVKVIQALPGVARAAFSMGSIIVRGAGTGDTHFYVDGVTIPILFHFGGLISTYNSNALASVDLYPGGFGTRYGSALAGVVELTGRRPKTDRVHGYLDANLFDASCLVEGPISEKASFLVSARRSYIANMLSFFLEKIAHVELPFNVVPYYWDYLARLDYDLTKNQHFYCTLFGAQDRLDLVVNEVRGGSSRVDEETNRATTDISFNMAISGWDWDLTSRLRNELRYAICDLTEQSKAFGYFTVDGGALAHYIRDQFSMKFSEAFTWNLGLDVQVIPYDIDLTTLNAKNEIVRDSSHLDLGPYGVYTGLEWKPVKRLTLMPGLRFDYYPELIYDGSVVPEFWNYRGFNNNRGISGEPSLRVSGRYELNDIHTVKLSAGTYNETPQPLGQAIDNIWGNPSLPAPKGSQYVAGYEWKITDLIHADLQTYFNRQWDVARTPSSRELAIDPSLPTYISNGKARMGGMELMLKHEQGQRFFGWLAYSLSLSQRWDYQNEKWTVYTHDQTHNLQLIGSYKLPLQQETGVRLRYVTGDPTTPLYPSTTFNAGMARRYEPNVGEYNSDRVDPYISFDVRYEKTFTYNTWLWHLYVDVTHFENLFGKGYKSPEMGQYRWNYDYNYQAVFSDVTRPALGIRVDF
ncbi:MAG: TonB-dependent receptor [Chitinispirillaceae bacterium]|nr:TonB-dependent receptor [Chitinispirillaceae bacterium]